MKITMNKNTIIAGGVGAFLLLTALLYSISSTSTAPQDAVTLREPKLLKAINVESIGINPTVTNIKDYASFKLDFTPTGATAAELAKLDQVVLLDDKTQVLGVYPAGKFTFFGTQIAPVLTIPNLGATVGNYIKDRTDARVNVALLDVNGDVLFGQGFPFADGYSLNLVKINPLPTEGTSKDLAIQTLLTPKSCNLHSASSKAKVLSISEKNAKSPIVPIKNIPKGVTDVYAECLLIDGTTVTSAPIKL